MHRGRLVIVAAAAIAVAAFPLPFLEADALGTIRGSGSNAALPLVALVAGSIVVVAGDRRDSLSGLVAIAAAGCVTVAFVTTGAVLIDAVLASREAAAIGADASLGVGLWLLTAAALVATTGIFLGMSRRLG
jgi:hypothetical protein